jgi:NADH:ubiquinone oxidoreductase subunit 2 (subunit N)
MIAQVALTTFFFAKNFIVIYISIELFSMIMYYIIIFESTNYKTKFNNNIYNTELSLKYFIISLFGSINVLIGIGFIFYSVGSLNFNTIRLYFTPCADGLEYFTGTGIKFGFITFIIGLLIKMGIAPYHF